MSQFDLPQPYLIFLAEVIDAGFAKTAFGLRDWAAELCVGELQLSPSAPSVGLPPMSPQEAYQKGARALVIGVAPIGGAIAQDWVPTLVTAMQAGLDIVSGMHARLETVPALAEAAARLGRRLHNVRTPPANLPIATGLKRAGLRLLTIGTDCALGKKYTALSLTRAFRARGIAADFRATGQTGIMIAGSGIPIDAVVSDFVAGAAEVLSPPAEPDHWDIIEGQGSLVHPSYAAVSLGLLHGSQPDVLVLCHAVGRDHVLGSPSFVIPSLREVIDVHILLGRRVNRDVRCAAISLNTAGLSELDAATAIRSISDETGLPCADPLRGGSEFAAVVDACLA